MFNVQSSPDESDVRQGGNIKATPDEVILICRPCFPFRLRSPFALSTGRPWAAFSPMWPFYVFSPRRSSVYLCGCGTALMDVGWCHRASGGRNALQECGAYEWPYYSTTSNDTSGLFPAIHMLPSCKSSLKLASRRASHPFPLPISLPPARVVAQVVAAHGSPC